MSDIKLVTLQTADGHTVEVEIESARMSRLLRSKIDDDPNFDAKRPIVIADAKVVRSALVNIFHWCDYRRQHPEVFNDDIDSDADSADEASDPSFGMQVSAVQVKLKSFANRISSTSLLDIVTGGCVGSSGYPSGTNSGSVR